jgi:hypothetical protein
MNEKKSFMMRRSDIAMAIQKINGELLQVIHEDIARLVFLASTRDYTASRYRHDELAGQLSVETTDKALAACHREVFERVAISPLHDIVWQLDSYLHSVVLPLTQVLHLWNKFTPYRVLPPKDCEPLVAELFCSDVKVALAILQARHQTALSVYE